MRRTLGLILILMLMASSQVFAVSPSGGYRYTSLIGPNSHTHVTTSAGARVYAITVTPSVANGFAQVLDLGLQLNVRNDGTDFISGHESKVAADISGATANTSIHAVYPDGIPFGDKMFVDCRNAYVKIYYRE